MKKKGFEEVLECLSETTDKSLSGMSDEEKKALFEEAKAGMKDAEELSNLIERTVMDWVKHHEDDDGNLMPKLVTGLSKGVCHLLVAFDEAVESSGHHPSSTFCAMLPMGMSLAKIGREIQKKMEHERMMKEGAN